MMRHGSMALVSLVLALGLLPCGAYCLMIDKVYIIDWKLVSVGGSAIYISMMVDGVSLLFSFTVLFIAANVFLFGVGYMQDEGHVHRFTGLLFLFVLSMGCLIFSPNLVGLLLGWDGLGLTSFLLVVHYQNAYAAGAGMVTALTNRIGDVSILLAISILLFGGSWHLFSIGYCYVCVGLIIVAAMTKSAQFPFCSWLPSAMAAPTPVSALVHSSTLVTAGIFLLIRFFPVFKTNGQACDVIFVVGSLTSFLAGLAALAEFDFKKVVAYSTLSQLGLMMASLGLGLWGLAFFHLLTHAMFKALLFLCVGVFIRFHSHGQDLRGMGNIAQAMPLARVGMLLASFALCGVPFMSGFYSKDAILECTWVAQASWIGCLLTAASSVCTTFYSARALGWSQLGVGLQFSVVQSCQDEDYFVLPINMLSFMSVVWGAVLNWLLVPVMDVRSVAELMGYFPLLAVIWGAGFIWWWVHTMTDFAYTPRASSLNWVEKLSNWALLEEGCLTLWFLSSMTRQYPAQATLDLGSKFIATIDQGWVEAVVSQGAHSISRVMAQRMREVFSQEPTVSLLLGLAMLLPLMVVILI